jgi:SUKH-4 immunity protein
VNSTINQLADAIAAHREYASRVCNVDEDDASRVVQELRRRLTVADAAATSDPEAWWSLILEQTENGLL